MKSVIGRCPHPSHEDEFERIELELSEPCCWCAGLKILLRKPPGLTWCTACGGSGSRATWKDTKEWELHYSAVSVNEPPPYISECLNGRT